MRLITQAWLVYICSTSTVLDCAMCKKYRQFPFTLHAQLFNEMCTFDSPRHQPGEEMKKQQQLRKPNYSVQYLICVQRGRDRGGWPLPQNMPSTTRIYNMVGAPAQVPQRPCQRTYISSTASRWFRQSAPHQPNDGQMWKSSENEFSRDKRIL